MNKFKAGDRIRRIGGWSRLLPVGEVCVVSWVNSNGGLMVEGRNNFWEDRHFELVEAAVEGDDVNHPKHYNSHPSGVECITIARHHNFNIGNVFKYLWRLGLKGSNASTKEQRLQEIDKAIFYLKDERARIEAE